MVGSSSSRGIEHSVTVSKASTNAARYRLVPVGAGSRRRSPEAGSILVISLCSDWLRMQTCLRCWSPWRNSAEQTNPGVPSLPAACVYRMCRHFVTSALARNPPVWRRTKRCSCVLLRAPRPEKQPPKYCLTWASARTTTCAVYRASMQRAPSRYIPTDLLIAISRLRKTCLTNALTL
jgi:hypothetical protein